MRWCVALALISTLLSSNALAAPKGKKGKNAKKQDKSGASIETTGTDPVKTETSDPGPYAPKGATGALAEEEEHTEEVKEVVKARPRDKALLFADLVVGFGNSPKPGPNRSNPSGGRDDQLSDAVVGSLLVGGRFDLSPKLSLGFRLPVSSSAVDRGGLGTQSHFALGAIEVLGEYRHQLSPLTTLPILFGLGLPTGTDDPDPSSGDNPNRTNTIADSARGWRDGELFWSKRVPLVLGIGIRHEARSLELRAATKLVTGFRLAGGLTNAAYYGAPNSELVNNPVAMRSVTDVGLSYSFTEKFWAGADLWAVANIIEPIHFKSNAEKPFLFQFVAEPLVGMRFGAIRPNVGFIIPLNGRLADGGMYGGHLRVDVAL